MQPASDTGLRLAGAMLAWLAGIALHLQQRELWPVAACIGIAAGGAALLPVAWRWRRLFAAALLGVGMLAFGSAGWHAHAVLDEALPPALEGQDVELTGTVASLPQRGASGLRFQFDVEAARAGGAAVALPPLLGLGWYRGTHEDAVAAQPRDELRAGQRWRFTVRLRQPHGHVNPHGFDTELYLFEQGVRATGYVRDGARDPAPARLADAAAHPVERLRQAVRDAIDAHVADRRAAGVLAALAIGDQGAIEHDDWDLFRATGIAHLVSISGLHVTMFAWLAGGLLGRAWRRSRAAMRACPAPLAARWGGLAAAAAYAVFSGGGVPSQRTVWMLAAVTVLQTLGVRWPWPLVLLAAAVVVTLFDPWALLQAGFWLSFMAVGLLMASEPTLSGEAPPRRGGAEPRPGRHDDGIEPGPAWRARAHAAAQGLRASVATQWRVTIGLTPLSLVFFQQVSLVGFAANLVAIPLVTLVITPLALLGAFAPPLWSAGAWFVQLLCGWLSLLAGVPGAVWFAPVAPAWAQLAGLLAAVLLALPLPSRARWLAVPLLLPLLWPARTLPAPGEFELLAADVGQGTAVLVRTRAHLLVYDAGPQYARDSDAGQRVLLPLLRARGEGRIDRLLLSHRDTDHVGGAPALLRGFPVVEMRGSLEPAHPLHAEAAQRAVADMRCEAGQAWDWDGVRFEILHPRTGDYAFARKPNAMSCVLSVRAADGTRALLTGDIEREQEAALVEADGAGLHSDVLIVAHHGSRTSSTDAFLEAVAPHSAVVQAGYRNRFGHPAAEVVARFDARGIRLLATPACGAWAWRSSTPPTQGACERERTLRYWRHVVGG